MNSLFVRWAIFDNKWLWFHMLAGAVAARLATSAGFEAPSNLLWVGGLGFLWEVAEYFLVDIEKEYGSKKRFFADAVGDFAGAFLTALLVIF